MLLGTSGCSIKKFALNRLGDALADTGTGFTSDDDPELIRDAAPFSLKLMESVLAQIPHHTGLLAAAASGFTQYGYAFVQQEADVVEAKDFAMAEALRARAGRLYRRARDYGLRSLEVKHPGFIGQLATQPREAAAKLNRKEVGRAYWTAASWGALISLSKNDPARVAELPQVEALIDRALELDESWGQGAIHTFLIAFEMSRQGHSAAPAERSRRHFDRAVALTKGLEAGPFVTYAESVAIEQQDAKAFDEMIDKALAIRPDEQPSTRLVNVIMQRRARWLKERKEDLFLQPADSLGK